LNLDIDALRSFVAVAEHRSFTRAAQDVARTQSTVSVQIKNLEERLGFALFERTKRSVELTGRGEKLLGYARNILKLNDEGIRAATDAAPIGRLRLGITEYFAPHHLPDIVEAFRTAYPTLDVEVTTGVTGYLRSLEKAGELDLVIGRREAGSDDGELICRERLHWVAAAEYRLRPGEPVSLALLPLGCGIRALATSSLEKMGRPWRAAYCGPSVLGLQTAVSAGMAVSCFTHSAVLAGFRQLGSKEGLPALPDSELALFSGKRGQTPLMRQLAEIVHEHFTASAGSVR
jgi:DNA-binding transcriptional LysR family regulator